MSSRTIGVPAAVVAIFLARKASYRRRAIRVLGAAAVLLSVIAPLHSRAAERFKPFKLKALDGSERTLADFTNRATLVVFFHPTCHYCLAALPKIQTITDGYKDRGLSAVWINVLPEENRLLEEWQAEHGLTAPILAATSSVQRNYGLTMTPTHYLIDSKGNVLWKHVGYKEGEESEIENEIAKALK